MASQAVDLGPFASEQGRPSPWAAGGFFLGLAAAVLAGAAIALDVGGATAFDPRPYAAPTGALASVASLVGLYQVSTSSRRGRIAATWGVLLGLVAAVASFVHGAVIGGSLEIAEFGTAYFDRDILSAIFGDIRRAAVNTIKYAAIAEVAAIVLGLIVAMLAISKRRWVRVPAIAYVDVIRGLPLLMLLLLVAFAPTYVGLTLPTITAFIVGLTINSSAYVAEIFRAGIQAVDKGQMDAARSLGMPYATAMTQVVIPQAVRKVIPPLTNEFISLVKDTSLLLVLGATVQQRELMTAARQLSSSTFSATPYMAASIGYLVVTIPLIRVVNWMERRLNPADSRRFRLTLMRREGSSAT
ncbi:MAG: amino acid ABC transporter permease [Actinomycetota bacterium]